MKKAIRSFLVLAAVLVCCSVLSGCLSHWFVDSSTRLQIENRTDVAILEVGIVSEDGKTVSTWIDETIQPGERSRVSEQDWVGTFHMRVRFEKWNGQSLYKGALCAVGETVQTPVYLAKKDGADVVEETDVNCSQDGVREQVYADVEMKFEGGSQYLVVSKDEDGKAQFDFR